jgi:hypothetical protein
MGWSVWGRDVLYNFEKRRFPSGEAPGISVFHRDSSSEAFHTYACYARGLDMRNGAYHILDLVPKGRDEANLAFTCPGSGTTTATRIEVLIRAERRGGQPQWSRALRR